MEMAGGSGREPMPWCPPPNIVDHGIHDVLASTAPPASSSDSTASPEAWHGSVAQEGGRGVAVARLFIVALPDLRPSRGYKGRPRSEKRGRRR